MTINESAEYANTSPRFIRRLVDEKRVPYLKLGRLVRLRAEDLDAYMDACRVEARTS